MKHFPTTSYSVFINGTEEYEDLDTIAFHGKCVFFFKCYEYWGGKNGKDYISKEYDSPTWGQAYLEAMKSQQVTLDFHHGFFEGLRKIDEVKGVSVLSMEMGS